MVKAIALAFRYKWSMSCVEPWTGFLSWSLEDEVPEVRRHTGI